MKKQNLWQAAITSMIVLAACSVENDLAVHGAWIREAPPSATSFSTERVLRRSACRSLDTDVLWLYALSGYLPDDFVNSREHPAQFGRR